MVTRPEVLAIIPARGGSKGIPHKNIRQFAGYPLIAYSIAAGLQASTVTRVIVSTDDEEIAGVAKEFGAEVPFLRPTEFAQDNTLDLPVFTHALNWMRENENYQPDVVVQLRPTSPIRPRNCVDEAIKLLLSREDADSVRGVVPAGQNPFKMWRIGENGEMKHLLDVDGLVEPYNAPRQSLPPIYWQTGHIDAIRPNVILQKRSMSGKVILPLLIDSRFTVDIDTPYDWLRYEWLVYHGGLDMVYPAHTRRPIPQAVKLLVLDFDGVLTDNRVWVDGNGREMIAAYRSDSIGIERVKQAGIDVIVLSSETDPVVTARCNKMKVNVIQGINNKLDVLQQYIKERNIDSGQVVYLGNDVNDLPCFSIVGCAVVVADAQQEVFRKADFILNCKGGYGAVRELCEQIIQRMKG